MTNGKLIRRLVDDEPFVVRCGELLTNEQILDLRRAIWCAWRSGPRPPARRYGQLA
jgi:hypothetical protein